MSNVQRKKGIVKRLKMLREVYVYEIDGLLIDTGPASAFLQLQSFFEQLEVQQIAITHLHEDHSGNAHWWWQHQQLPIYLHAKSVEEAQKKGRYPLYRRLFWGPRLPFPAQAIPQRLETEHHQFKVIETPGHSDDSISLYEENEGWLFTGDLYITSKPKLFLKEESIPKTIASLKKLLRLQPTTLFCGHSGKLDHAEEKLQSKLDYLLNLQHTILEMNQKGWTKEEIMKKLFPKPVPIIYLSNKEFSYMRAIDSVLNND